MSDSPIKKPVFMIGMPRSGTTAISEALSLHPSLGWFSNYLGRLPDFPFVAYFDRITNHPSFGWWLRGKKSQSKGLLSSLRRFLPHTDEAFAIWERCCGSKFLWDYLINQTASQQECECMRKYIHRVLKCQNKKRFFTKLTGPSRICYLQSIFPDSIFIHTIRDPRAVISSLKQVSFWKDGKGLSEPWWKNGLPHEYIEEWKNHGKTSVALAAVQWKRVVELTWEEKKFLLPTNYIEIRYEDFVMDSHGILQKLFSILGLDNSLEAHQYLSSFGEIRNMNYKFSENLTADEIIVIEEITEKIAHKAGYTFLRN
jgi:hypothetical protein